MRDNLRFSLIARSLRDGAALFPLAERIHLVVTAGSAWLPSATSGYGRSESGLLAALGIPVTAGVNPAYSLRGFFLPAFQRWPSGVSVTVIPSFASSARRWSEVLKSFALRACSRFSSRAGAPS